jgi:hypothetical protein
MVKLSSCLVPLVLMACGSGEGSKTGETSAQGTGGTTGVYAGSAGQGGSDTAGFGNGGETTAVGGASTGGVGGESGSAGSSGETSTCSQGNIYFCDNENCQETFDLCLCRPVADVQSDFVFGYCDIDNPDASESAKNCGAGCGEQECCRMMVEDGGLFCTDFRVCDEGLKRGTGFFTYSDYTFYKGQDIPKPEFCPQDITAIKTCSLNCGWCDEGQVCSGRSPTHPLGLCFDKDPDQLQRCNIAKVCGDEQLCFFWSKGEEGSKSDSSGVCMDKTACLQVAMYLPGGAFCKDSEWHDATQ